MKTTRRTLFAENTELKARIAACQPESRKGLKTKLAATREENKRLTKQNASLQETLNSPIALRAQLLTLEKQQAA